MTLLHPLQCIRCVRLDGKCSMTDNTKQEDLVSFGKLVISMACEFFAPGQHPAAPLDHITRNYSSDLKNVILFLISKPQPNKTVDDVIRMLGSRMLNELDAMQKYVEALLGLS